ncbi:MAG: peptidoglycan DD-metalloendopeptidase family protein [Rhodospirillaceae bacterium]|nr:peptidoglycan DD-metalloendopeptidase family protein [Rhodospirillaceae bacterium]
MAAVSAMFALQTGEAAARNERDRLEEVERRIDKGRGRDAALTRHAGKLAVEVRALRQRVVSVARRLQVQESALMRVKLGLARLEEAIRRDNAEYRRNERQFLRIVGALRRIRSNPPGVLAMHFADAQDAIRSTIVLRSLVPRLRARADLLRRKAADYNKRRRNVSRQREDIAAKAGQLRGTRQELAALLGRQVRLLAETREEKAEVHRRLARLTREAETLHDLMANLERETTVAAPKRPARAATLTRPERLRRFRDARGRVVPPVPARVVKRFSDRDRFGLAVNGLRFAARAGTQAVAPYDGQIVFAGSFRSYGPILIIEHTDGYHSLIAGLVRIDVVNRQWVLAGEPVGIVGKTETPAPWLYLELRQRGRPIDPQPWLAADKRKVDG